MNRGGVGGESSCEEFEANVSAGKDAAVTTEIGGLAAKAIRTEFLLSIENLDLHVFPKYGGAELVADRRAGACAGGRGDYSAIRWREEDLNLDADDFRVRIVILFGLLSAVVGLPAGILDEKGERGKERNGVDVRAGGGRRKNLGVTVKEAGHGVVMALTKEIGFADGFVGEGRLISQGERRQQQGRSEER